MLLIIDRFQHFEQLADVQMLAMLSCVLSESSMVKGSVPVFDTEYSRLPSQNQRASSNGVGQKNDTSSGYYPTFEVARNLLRSQPPKLSDPEKRISGPQSTSSSVGATTSDPLIPFSTGTTPPNLHRNTATTFERTDSHMSVISAPLEHHRNTYRVNSNLASTFAASLSRPFSFNAPVSSSPPTASFRKRLSPAGSYTGAPSAGINWGATTLFGKPSTIAEDPKSVYSLSVSDTEEDIAAPKPLSFTTRLKNQDQFDNEGYASISLLNPDLSSRYCAYRELYAHMLYIWDLPLARCEVLKQNDKSSSVVSKMRSKSVKGFSSSLIAIGRSTTDSMNADEETGPRLGFRTQGTTLASKTFQQHEDPQGMNTAFSESLLICLLCAEIIRGLSSPCLGCGHVLHASCRSILPSLNVEATEHGECISGCGCRCADHPGVEVATPLLYHISPSPTIVGSMSNEQEQHRWREEAGNDEDVWEDVVREDVAYESLARVRERYITPKPSQIWRGN